MTTEQIAATFPPTAFAFAIFVGELTSKPDCFFAEVSGLAAETLTETVRESGENRFVHQLPSGVKHSPLTLKRGIAQRSSELARWCSDVLGAGLTKPIATQQVKLCLLDETGKPVCSWLFDGAYPVKWQVARSASDDDALAIEQMELNYSSFKRQL